MSSYPFFLLTLIVLVCATVSVAQYAFSNKKNAIKWSRLDVDIRDIEVLFDDGAYRKATPIYALGTYAKPRTLKSLSASAGSVMGGEPTFKLYRQYWKTPRYADAAVIQIIGKFGPYGKQSQLFRADAGIKTIQYQSMWMWVIHQMELSIKLCRLGRKQPSIMQWDYAVADYMGSFIVEDPNRSGYLLHTLAVKRCEQFGTCAGLGKAKINNKIYNNFRQGKNLLRQAKCQQVAIRKNRIISFMYIPLIQGCIRYLVKTSRDEGESKQKSNGEAWAFCAAFLPKLNSCNKGAAAAIKQNLGPKIKKPMSANSPENLISRIHKSLKCMGLKCADVGFYNEFDDFTSPKCT